MIQDTLFDMPEPAKRPPVPPVPPKPVALAELGPCVKCGEPATLKSPSGTLYCQKHGYCQRRTCLKSVEKFVWHPRLERYVCSCVLAFDRKIEQIERKAV